MTTDHRLRLAYFAPPDGPRVIVFGPIDADFDSLRRLFTDLGRATDESRDLHTQPFISVSGRIKVTLACTGPHSGLWQGFRQIDDRGEPIFRWQRMPRYWRYLAGLLEPFVQGRTPCHQYMTNYPREAAIVVVSRGEYADNILKYSVV